MLALRLYQEGAAWFRRVMLMVEVMLVCKCGNREEFDVIQKPQLFVDKIIIRNSKLHLKIKDVPFGVEPYEKVVCSQCGKEVTGEDAKRVLETLNKGENEELL